MELWEHEGIEGGLKSRQGQGSGKQKRDEVGISLWTDEEAPWGETRTHRESWGAASAIPSAHLSLTQAHRCARTSGSVYFYSCISRAAYLLCKRFFGLSPMGAQALGESHQIRWARAASELVAFGGEHVLEVDVLWVSPAGSAIGLSQAAASRSFPTPVPSWAC